MVKYFLIQMLVLGFSAVQAWGDALCFEEAWERILECNPSLAVADAEIAIREAEKKQVSLMLNPVLGVDAENLGISHPNEDTDPPQVTYSLSQTLELGGKRGARRALASSLTSLAFWDRQIERSDMLLEAQLAFIEVATAQEWLQVAQERVALAECEYEAISLKVKGGKVSPLQEKKSQIALMGARMVLHEKQMELEQSKKALALLWGGDILDFNSVDFDFYEYEPPPCVCAVLDGIYATADLARAQQHVCSASKNLKLQKANAIPDLTLTVGYRVFNDSNQNGWVVAAQLPLPFFDYNQGNIQRAYSEIEQAGFESDAIALELKERVTWVFDNVTTRFLEAEMLCTGLYAEALEVFYLTRSGYQKGKIDYLEVAEVQKTLLEIKEKYIETLYGYHLNRAELARWSGGNL